MLRLSACAFIMPVMVECRVVLFISVSVSYKWLEFRVANYVTAYSGNTSPSSLQQSNLRNVLEYSDETRHSSTPNDHDAYTTMVSVNDLEKILTTNAASSDSVPTGTSTA